MPNKHKTEKSKGRKIYDIISTIVVACIFVFLVIVVGIMLWQRKSGGDFSLFGYRMYTVATESMQGTINVGDVIIGKEVDPNTLKEGDIITFIAPSGNLKGYPITHRIIEVHYKDDGSVDYFITKGDNDAVAPEPDDWHLQPSSVKTKYIKTSEFLAGFRQFLSKWYGYVVLIVLPLVTAFGLLIFGYVRDRVNMEKDKIKSDVTLDNLSEDEKKKLLQEYAFPIDGSAQNSDAADGGNPDEGARSEDDPDVESQKAGDVGYKAPDSENGDGDQ